MIAILLSAGMGTRMRPHTKKVPKALLRIDEKNTLLDIQITKLKRVKVDEIVIVSGYRGDQIEEHVKKKYPKEKISVLYNPFYSRSNNLATLWFARKYMKEPFIVINGDDLFQSSLIKGLIEEKSRKEIVVTTNRKKKYDDDDMRVLTQGNKVKKIGKKIKKFNSESVGIIKFQGKGIRKFRNLLENNLKNEKNLDKFWLKAVQDYIEAYDQVGIYEVDREQWEEIDFHGEYNALKEKGKTRFYFQKEPLKLKNNRNRKVHKIVRKIKKGVFFFRNK